MMIMLSDIIIIISVWTLNFFFSIIINFYLLRLVYRYLQNPFHHPLVDTQGVFQLQVKIC